MSVTVNAFGGSTVLDFGPASTGVLVKIIDTYLFIFFWANFLKSRLAAVFYM